MTRIFKRIKIMTVFGTRPEAIKMCPLILKFRDNPYINSKVCITSQHREMLQQVLEIFNINPDYNLDIMKNNQSLSDITTNILQRLDIILKKEKPDLILVHGDTTTTFSAALCAFYNKIKIGHVEAGLRTYDKYFPFPEEINRVLTSALADIHFAPTNNSKENLLKEGISSENIFITGNTVIDAMKNTVNKDYLFNCIELNKIDFDKKVIMVTAHRRENHGSPLENICEALKEIAEANKGVEIIYLAHLNPNVQEVTKKYLKGIKNIHLLSPLNIKETHNLMDRCYLILTDSGGIQEEAPYLGTPVLVLRNNTERPEAISAGTVKLIGTNKENILKEVNVLLNDRITYNKMSYAINPYGDGKACRRIVNDILYYFGVTKKRPLDFKI